MQQFMEESHRSIHDSLMIVKRCLKNREVRYGTVRHDTVIGYKLGLFRRAVVVGMSLRRGFCLLVFC